MRAEFVNPFFHAACEVLRSEAGAVVQRGELAIEESYYTTKDITVMIGVTGKVEGVVLYGTSEGTANRLASAMLGQRIAVFDQLTESAIAELGNVISGVASRELEQVGLSCTISPPSLLIGRGTIISTVNIKRLVIPLHMEQGELEISLALR